VLPVVTQQPAAQEVLQGTPVSFTVAAQGSRRWPTNGSATA